LVIIEISANLREDDEKSLNTTSGAPLPLKNVDGHDITASQALAEPAKPE